MSTTRGIAELTARQDGGVLVFAAMLMPVVLLFLALSVDIGNWWVHKRHLQLQVDAAASPAAHCSVTASPTRPARTSRSRTKRPDSAARRLELQRAGRRHEQGVDHAPLPERDVRRRLGRGGRHRDAAPCDTPSLMFDVKGSEANLPLIFQIPGLSDVAAINAHARVQLKLVEVQEGMLPVAVPDLRFTYVFATFVNEVTGSSRDGAARAERYERKRPALEHAGRNSRRGQLRPRRSAASPRRRDRSERCLRAALHGVLRPRFSNGVVHIRGWTAGAAPAVRNAWLLPGSCLPDAYFATEDCSGGIQAEVDLGATHPLTGTDVTAEVWASVDGAGTYQLTPGGTSGVVTWTAGSGLPFAGEGPHGRAQLELEADVGHLERPDLQRQEQQSVQGGGNVRSRPASVRRRPGALRPLKRVQVFESGVTSSGSNSFQTGTTPTLGLSIAVTGSLKVQSEASDPVVELRVTGSQNQSIDCDPAFRTSRTRSSRAVAPPTRSTPASPARRTTSSGRSPSPGNASRHRRVGRSARSSTG